MNTRIGKPARLNASGSLSGERTLVSVDEKVAALTAEAIRAHNRNQTRLGTELVNVVRRAGLEEVSSKEILGRLLWTKEQPNQEALPSVWNALAEAAMVRADPKRHPTVMSVLVSDVGPDEPEAQELRDLGLRYDRPVRLFRGRASVPDLLVALVGTSAGITVFPGARRAGDEADADDEGLVLLVAGRPEPATMEILDLTLPAREPDGGAAAKPDADKPGADKPDAPASPRPSGAFGGFRPRAPAAPAAGGAEPDAEIET